MTNGEQSASKKELTELERRLIEAIGDSEKRLLTAFYVFAEAAQKHQADLDRSDASLRERISALEARLTELEKRLNMLN